VELPTAALELPAAAALELEVALWPPETDITAPRPPHPTIAAAHASSHPRRRHPIPDQVSRLGTMQETLLEMRRLGEDLRIRQYDRWKSGNCEKVD
jgi:hypothetical protein